jgi:hypothetical protein
MEHMQARVIELCKWWCMLQPTQFQLWCDEQGTPHKELPVRAQRDGISGEVKEQWLHHHSSTRVEQVIIGVVVGHEEEGVVIWEEGVADGEDFTTDSGH